LSSVWVAIGVGFVVPIKKIAVEGNWLELVTEEAMVEGRKTLVRLKLPLNALSPMLVTLGGIVTLVRLQPWNANDSMLVTLEGIEKLVRDTHPRKAPYWMLVRLELRSKVTLASLIQEMNAYSPMLVTLEGIVIEVTESFHHPPKIGLLSCPTLFTGYPPSTLGIVTAPVAVEAVIVAAPKSSTI
jgi:hypothetical protein